MYRPPYDSPAMWNSLQGRKGTSADRRGDDDKREIETHELPNLSAYSWKKIWRKA